MAVNKSKETTKDGRSWFFQVWYTTLSGERKKYKSKKYALKRDAEEAERIFLMSLTNKIETNDLTIKDLIDNFVNFQKDKVKVTTFYSYRKKINHLTSLFKIKANDFSIVQYNLWKNDMNNKKLTLQTKNTIYKFLRSVLNYGKKYLDLDFNKIDNKMTSFSNPNELKKEMLFWSYDEFKQFIVQEKELKYKAYFETLYYCGLRKGEANALTWKDIDFNNHTISINKNITLKIKGEEYVILPPKTKSSIRILSLPKALENDLRTLYSEYSKYNNFINTWFVYGGVIPLKDSTVTKRKHNNCINANIKEIRIHDFRHSCASLLISNGASISLVAKYLGHSNISTTLNTYTHMFKNEMSDIINIIDKL